MSLYKEPNANVFLERIIRAVRRRTRVLGAFPNGWSALMLTAAVLRDIPGTRWGATRYLITDSLKEVDRRKNLLLRPAGRPAPKCYRFLTILTEPLVFTR
jgi:hypothetical protein